MYLYAKLKIRKRFPQLPATLGCSLGHAVPDSDWTDRFCEAFNAAAISVEWKNVELVEGEYRWDTIDAQVEWCTENKLLMYGGPLLDLSPDGLPGWLWQWEKDFANLQSFVSNYVETSISRYVDRIRNWELAARANTARLICKRSGTGITPSFGALPDRAMEQVRKANVGETLKLIGWKPKTSVEDGLDRTYEWYSRGQKNT